MLRNTIKSKIVLVPFPLDDLSGIKHRPALCLTRVLGPYRQILVAYITSQIPSSLLPSDLILEDTHPDFARSGLSATSAIRLHQIVTSKDALIVRVLGELPADLQSQVEVKLRRLLGLEKEKP